MTRGGKDTAKVPHVSPWQNYYCVPLKDTGTTAEHHTTSETGRFQEPNPAHQQNEDYANPAYPVKEVLLKHCTLTFLCLYVI